MDFPIKLNFDNNVKYIIINLISRFFLHIYFPSSIYIYIFSFIISIICFLIRKKYFKNTDKNIVVFNTHKKHNYEKLISNNKEYFNIILIYLLLLIIRIINIIKQLNSNGIFYIFIFSGFILIGYLRNEKIYKHQKISYIILFTLFGFILFFSFQFSSFKITTLISISIVSILYYYTLGLINGYLKYSMEIKFIDPYFITIVQLGHVLMINLVIAGYYYFKFELNEILYDFQFNLNYKNFFNYFISTLLLFSYYLFDILVCYYYSPYHQSVCYYFSYFLDRKEQYFLVQFRYNKQIYIISYIINIFFSCVVADIIILNFCGLEKDTKYEIQKRAEIPNINETLLEPNDEYSLALQSNN